MRRLIDLFRKKRGCLYGKTQEEKNMFFDSLIKMKEHDYDFFIHQVHDLHQDEKDEFLKYVLERNEHLKVIKAGLNLIETLISKSNE